MYKAIHLETSEEIIILHPDWLQRISRLREMDRADRLVCQGCRQPLRVKAGQFKRPHFAHKHLQACSYGTESPELLHARAVLYEWLFMQFGPAVTLEKEIEGANLPRPVDCWVEGCAAPFAYWIIENGIRHETRQSILTAFTEIGVKTHWIFLHHMLSEDKKEFHSLLLSPTERAFMQSTRFDEMLAVAGEVGTSLYYLDAQANVITTYRGLVLHHRPNWFKGLKKKAQLAEIRASSLDGSLVYPGELDRLQLYRKKQQRLEAKKRIFQQREEEWAKYLAERKPAGGFSRNETAGGASRDVTEELPCEYCGQITTNYWSTFFDDTGRKLCRCRECLEGDR